MVDSLRRHPEVINLITFIIRLIFLELFHYIVKVATRVKAYFPVIGDRV